jgi:hypothetical protein
VAWSLFPQEISPSPTPSEEPVEVVTIPKLPEVTVPAATFADPTYRISKLAAANKRLADSLTSYYLALAGGTMPFIRRYSTI